MKVCINNPNALLLVKLGECSIGVDCVLFHGDDSIVLEMNEERVVIGDIQSHQLLRVNDEDMNVIQHNVILDLSNEGERWEGDVLQNKPFGWGVLYDSENRMVYEGFRIGGVNVCYGTQYYSDIQKVEYEGEWCEGKRWGRGVQHDRKGAVQYDGEWVKDEHAEKRVVLSEENQLLHNQVEVLIVKDNSCNGTEWKVLDFSFMPRLRKLEIGDNCFEKVEKVKLNGLNELERVEIGYRSLRQEDMLDSSFEMKDCEKVKELIIGYESLTYFTDITIKNVPSLEKIDMEGSCFYWSSLELKGCDSNGVSSLDLLKLQSLVFGSEAFGGCEKAVFESLLCSCFLNNRPSGTARDGVWNGCLHV